MVSYPNLCSNVNFLEDYKPPRKSVDIYGKHGSAANFSYSTFGKLGDKFGLSLAFSRPIPGPYQANTRPISGQYQAAGL